MASKPAVRIEKIRRGHDRSDVDCGEKSLNEYIRRYARQNDEKGIGATYVAVREGEDAVLAFYTISSGQIAPENLPDEERKGMPHYPVPVIRLGRLGVDKAAAGEGLGGHMLVDALRRAAAIAEILGVYAVEVDAKSDEVRSFYTKYGFHSLIEDQLHLYMSIKTIRRLFDAGG